MAAKVALVTGGSSGIGQATALKLHELGYTTYAAARRVQRMEHLSQAGIRPLAMDVTDEESLKSGVKHILAEEGRIDVLVNGAGYGSYGALEDVPLSEARDQFEVNVFGAATLTQLVLPHMRAQHSWTIINITSMGGKIYTPPRRLVPRHQIRPRSPQRLPAPGAQAVRHQCRGDRTRGHPDRMARHRSRQADESL